MSKSFVSSQAREVLPRACFVLMTGFLTLTLRICEWLSSVAKWLRRMRGKFSRLLEAEQNRCWSCMQNAHLIDMS